MKTLSDRAVRRCETNTLRGYPAWKQAEILATGTEEQKAQMQSWIGANKAHLADIRARIADGQAVCIDSGWPKPGERVSAKPPEPAPTISPDTLSALEAAQAKLKRDAPAEPPAEIADLFDPNLTPRQNQEALIAKFASFKSEEERYRSYGDSASMSKAMDFLRRAEHVDSGIKWNRAVNAEVVG